MHSIKPQSIEQKALPAGGEKSLNNNSIQGFRPSPNGDSLYRKDDKEAKQPRRHSKHHPKPKANPGLVNDDKSLDLKVELPAQSISIRPSEQWDQKAMKSNLSSGFLP